MKKTIDRLAHKYALNIKQIRGQGPTKIGDFKNLNKNFYDDIEDSITTIRGDRKLLNKIKDHSIKEFIYSNKEIPNIWKNKLNYQDEVLNVIYKDKKLLSYIGSSPKDYKKNSFDEFPKIKYDGPKTFRSRNDNNYFSKKEISIMGGKTESNTNNYSMINNTMNKEIKIKYTPNKKGKLSEKEINTLLDVYKNVYPIKEKLNELYINSNYYKLINNKNENNKNNLDSNNDNEIIKKEKAYNSIDNIYHKLSRHTFVPTDKKLINKRQKTFRQNIFNNLSSYKKNNITLYSFNKNKLFKRNVANRLINLKTDKKNDDLSKLNEINNPIIKKNIENINFYGPYCSFCPTCRNKNIEYYKNMEPNQCLKIINLIKKVKNKKTLMDIKRTTSVSPNKKSIAQKETFETEKRINSKNDNSEKEHLLV